MFEEDGELPACVEGDCLIPEVKGEAGRLLELYTMLKQLGGLVNPDRVFEMYSVSPGDLRSIAEIESGLKAMEKKTNG